MKVTNNSNNIYNNKIGNQQKSQTNFKGLMDIPGAAMQALENSGFIGSFLVQDTLGMTFPRVYEGLKRDVPKEHRHKIKHMNFKQGAEDFIREALSGPLMMFTPVAVLLLGKKFVGKSSFINSNLIKRFGNNLTETVKAGTTDASKLRKDFYRNNITKIVQNTTTASDKVAESEFINKVLDKVELLDKYDEKIATSKGRRRKLYRKAQQRNHDNIIEMFNEFHKSHNSNFNMVNKVKIDNEYACSTDKAIGGLRAYAHDIIKPENMDKMSATFTEQAKKQSMIKRGIVNLSAALSTVGVMSLVPKIYAFVNPVPPGALSVQDKNSIAQNNIQNQNNSSQNNKKGDVSFTGKYDKIAKSLEFNGNQMTPLLMGVLSVLGLMVPRISTAVKRAPENPNTHKKDYTEVKEAATRDIASATAVTVGVPWLAKGIVSSYEDKSGFVLRNKSKESRTPIKSFLNKINPLSDNPYSLKDLNHIYAGIDTPEKLNNFAEFVNENDGSLAKIFNTSKHGKEVFAAHGLDIKALADNPDRKAANKQVMDKLADKNFSEKLMQMLHSDKSKTSSILKRARSLTSVPSFVSTVVLIPLFLGLLLPKFIFRNTRKAHERMAEEAKNDMPAQPQMIPYKYQYGASSPVFSQLKH